MEHGPDAMSGGVTADPTGLSEGEQQLTPEAEGMIWGYQHCRKPLATMYVAFTQLPIISL